MVTHSQPSLVLFGKSILALTEGTLDKSLDIDYLGPLEWTMFILPLTRGCEGSHFCGILTAAPLKHLWRNWDRKIDAYFCGILTAAPLKLIVFLRPLLVNIHLTQLIDDLFRTEEIINKLQS